MRTTEAKAAPRISAEQAEYEASWQAQIEALTAPGLSDEERVGRFADAAEFPPAILEEVFEEGEEGLTSPARALWEHGTPERSLFAYLPGCGCPVEERLDGVPSGHKAIPDNWHPTADQLRIFAHHQRNARFPG